jgi:hypothetical protein
MDGKYSYLSIQAAETDIDARPGHVIFLLWEIKVANRLMANHLLRITGRIQGAGD